MKFKEPGDTCAACVERDTAEAKRRARAVEALSRVRGLAWWLWPEDDKGAMDEPRVMNDEELRRLEAVSALEGSAAGVLSAFSAAPSVAVMHSNCVACLSVEVAGPEATLAILVMMRGGTTLEEITADLCFAHRKMIR